MKTENRSVKARCLLVITGQYCSCRQFKENAILLTQYFNHGEYELDAGMYQSTRLGFFSKARMLTRTQIC